MPGARPVRSGQVTGPDLTAHSVLPYTPFYRILRFTVIVFVYDGHFGPVQKRYDVSVRLVQQTLFRVQVDGQPLGRGVHVQSGLDVRQVQGVAHGMHVRGQVAFGGTEQGGNAQVELAAR